LFALSLSFQTGLKLDTSQAYYFGFLTDYFIFSIHIADILILILSLTFLKIDIRQIKYKKIAHTHLLLVSSTIVLVSAWIISNPNHKLLLFGLIRIFLFLLTVFVIKKICKTKIQTTKTLQIISTGIISGLIISISIGLVQFTSGLSPNIPLIGSYSFSSSTPNIATSYFLDHKFLRAYGTTPHPNILSALIVFGIALLSFTMFIKKQKPNFAYIFSLGILLLGIIISFSRTGILMLAIFFLVRIKKSFPNYNKYFVLISILVLGLVLSLISGLTLQSKSITERFELNLVGFKIFIDSPFFGVGVGNYLVGAQNYFFQSFNLRLFQPPHNAIILFLTEYGLVGVFIVVLAIFRPLVLLFQSQSKLSQYLLIPILLAFMFGSLFDHYFLTQFQTNYILAIVFGLILVSNKMLDWK